MLAVVLMPLDLLYHRRYRGRVRGTHTLIKIVKGKASQIHVLMWIVSIASLIYFASAAWLSYWFFVELDPETY